ncbi:MAG: AraC family transcriptional regulator [Clostridia bacterium]|nr:AraC family transcriptional regulator [Clostridia bacterium]
MYISPNVLQNNGNISYDRNDFERLPTLVHEKDLTLLGTSGDIKLEEETVFVRKVVRSERNELEISHYLKIYYMLSGDASVNMHDSTVEISEKEILLISPAVPHLFKLGNNAKSVVILLPPSIVKKNFNKIVEYQSQIATFITNAIWGEVANAYMLFGKTNNSYIYCMLDMLISEQSYPSVQSNTLKLNIMLCLIGYLSSYTPSEYDISAMRLFRCEQIPKILNYINDNFRTVTLEKLAENFHYTVPYVSKLIRNATGLTFTEILRETRFDVCRSLLLNSEMKINRIAEIAGFQNTDHFNRIFKKRMGVTPSDYKKKKTDSLLTTV